MKKESKYSVSLTYGDREAEVLQDIDELIKNKVLPENKNEIFRRGLHICRYLAEVNEKPLLNLLSNYLHLAEKTLGVNELDICISLAIAIYSTMISKHGILKAEMFETVPMNLKAIENLKKIQIVEKKPEVDASIRKSIGELATSVDTIFLKKNETNMMVAPSSSDGTIDSISLKDIKKEISDLKNIIMNVRPAAEKSGVISINGRSADMDPEEINRIGKSIKKQKDILMEKSGINEPIQSKIELSEELKNHLKSYIDLRKKFKNVTDEDIDIPETIKDANFSYYQGSYEEASNLYDTIINKDPTNIDALVNKGIVLYRLGELEKAVPFFDKALNIDPTNINALAYNAFILNRLRKIEDAKPLYEKFIETVKIIENDIQDNVDVLVNIGIALDRLDRKEEAKEWYEKAIKVEDKKNIDFLANKGIAMDRLGRHQEAFDYYEKAINIDPRNVFVLYHKTCNLALQGKIDDAKESLKRVIDLCPRYEKIANNDQDLKEVFEKSESSKI